jgi:hypothetical protein
MHPRARQKDLLVRHVEGETIVYDLREHRAHYLNAAAAAIWQGANGRRDTAEIARVVTEELGSPITPDFVLLALDRLRAARLLDRSMEAMSPARRTALKRLMKAGGAALAAPAVLSIVAPTAAYAASGCIAATVCPGANANICCDNAGMPGSCSGGGMCMGPPPPGCAC